MRRLLFYCLFISFFCNTIQAQVELPLKGSSGETLIGLGAMSSFDVTNDGSKLVVGSSLGVMIYDAETDELIHVFREHRIVDQVVISEDDTKVLSASTDGSVLLWDINTHEVLVTIDEFEGPPFDMTISPDNQFIAIAAHPPNFNSINDNEVQVWDVNTGTLIHSYKRPSQNTRNNDTFVTFSPDSSKLLFAGNIVNDENNTHSIIARIMDVNSGEVSEVVQNEPVQDSTVFFIQYINEGASFLIGSDMNSPIHHIGADGNISLEYHNTISEWDSSTFTIINEIQFENALGRTTSFSLLNEAMAYVVQKTGESYSETYYYKINLLDQSTEPITIETNITDPTVSKVTTNGFVYFSGLNSFVKWNTDVDQVENTVDSYHYGFGAIAKFINIDTELIGIASKLKKEDFGSGIEFVSGIASNFLYKQDIQTGEIIQTYIGHEQSILSMDISQDETKIISGSFDNTARVWDVSTGETLSILEESNRVEAVVFFHDSNYCVTSSSSIPIVWDSTTGEKIVQLDGDNMHTDKVTTIKIGPNDDFFVTGSMNGIAKVWNVNRTDDTIEIEYVKTFEFGNRKLESFDISPDGNLLATVSLDTTVSVWNIETMEQVTSLNNDSINVPIFALFGTKPSVAFSPDGRYLAAGGGQRLLSVWDTLNWEMVKSFEIDPFFFFTNIGVSQIDFSTDSSRIVNVMGNSIGHNEFTARIWQIEEPSTIQNWMMLSN